MTISELIAELEKIRGEEGDIRVLVSGYEMYWDDPHGTSVVDAYRLDYDPDYMGKYVGTDDCDFEDCGETFKAVVIPR